jgi:hypothetical protein
MDPAAQYEPAGHWVAFPPELQNDPAGQVRQFAPELTNPGKQTHAEDEEEPIADVLLLNGHIMQLVDPLVE